MYNPINEQFMFQAMQDRIGRIDLRKQPRRRWRGRTTKEPTVRQGDRHAA